MALGARGDGGELAATTSATVGPSGASGPVSAVGAVYVGTTGCDDKRAPEEVTTAGTPWCTLTRAAAAAPAGSDVLIAPGRYAALVANGATAPPRLAFRAATPARPPVIAGGTIKNGDGYRFDGLRFTARLTLNRSRDIAVHDNAFAGATLYIKQSQRIAVTGNRMAHYHGVNRGILLQSSYTAKVPTNTDITIAGNAISDLDHDAIAVYNGYRRLTIAANRISDVHQPRDFPYHSDAMQLMGGDGLTIEGNVVSDATHGILIKDGRPATHTVVRRNLVVAVGGAALQLYNAPGALVQANTFWRARYGIILANARNVGGVTRASLIANVLVSLTSNGRGLVGQARGNVFGRGARVGRPAYRGTPNFLDPRKGNYRISRTRPGAGIRAGGVLPGPQLKVLP